MILTAAQKTDAIFEELARMNDAIFTADERASREKLRAHFLQDDIFILKSGVESKIVAFAFVTERGGPYLMIMAVDPAYQKCGNGRLLLDQITEYYSARQRMEISLTCKVDNVAAQVLYLKSGFRPVRVIPKYYGATDGLLMRRCL